VKYGCLYYQTSNFYIDKIYVAKTSSYFFYRGFKDISDSFVNGGTYSVEIIDSPRQTPQPKIGAEPRQRYAFLHDGEFYDSIGTPRVEHGPEHPAKRNLEAPSGQWYTATWNPHETNYAYIKNGKLWLRQKNEGTEMWDWGGSLAVQGRGPHIAVQVGKFKGSNTTENDAVDTLRVVFPLNETIPSETYWLYTKLVITKHGETIWENENPHIGVGILLVFQMEIYDTETGETFLTDYDNPDFFNGEPNTHDNPAVVFFDIFLANWIYYPWGYDIKPIGWEFVHAASAYDGDLHVQRVEGVIMPSHTGIWHSFKVDLGYAIERCKNMTYDAIWKGFWGGQSVWLGWQNFRGQNKRYQVKSLILRQVQVYIESSGAMIEAVWDYVIFSTDPYLMQRIDLRSYDWSDYDGVSGSPAPAVWEIDYEFWGVSKGDKGPTIYLPKNSYHRVEVEDPLWQWNSSSQTWIVWHFFQYWNDEVAPLLSSENPLEIYTGIYDGYMHALFYKEEIEPVYGGGGSLFELVGPGDASGFMMTESPPVEAEYGQIKRVNQSGWIDKVTFVRIRQTLGNQHGDLVVSVFLKEKYKTIVIKLNNIEKIIIDLGRIMEVYGYNQNFWSYQVDDFTMTIETQNVTYTDFILLNVPPLLTLKKNGIAMPKGSFWNYTNGHLHFRLYSGDPEIYVDFETAFSLTYNVLIQSSTVLIAMLTVALLYKKLRSLKL
jgi:hypothetical protein